MKKLLSGQPEVKDGRMIKRNTSLVWILGACLLLTGCSFKKAEEKGKEIFPEVQKFDRLMDKTNHEIVWNTGGPLSWGGRGIVYGRYLIYMEFEVSVNVFNEPKRTSDPFYIVDEYVYRTSDSGSKYVSSTIRGRLSRAQWDQVQKVDDIFKILGIVPITNQPIDGIEKGLIFY
jgi:hypothetical protein